jgi:hypothetical protein
MPVLPATLPLVTAYVALPPISVTELEAKEAAPILKQYLLKATAARPYFDATKDAPLSAFEDEAPRHPVFQITTVEEPSR